MVLLGFPVIELKKHYVLSLFCVDCGRSITSQSWTYVNLRRNTAGNSLEKSVMFLI